MGATDSTQNWAAVSRTALGVARVRARESQRPDRLFLDPYAQALLGGLEPTEATSERATEATTDPARRRLAFHVVVRTRFYDDYLLDATARGNLQVVVLASGLDTRALRLPWPPGVRLFELDLPPVLTFKRAALQELAAMPRCGHVLVPADLRQDWAAALVAAGFDAERPTAWLAEGLLVYLSAEEAAALLSRIGDLSAPGSRLATEGGEAGLTPAHDLGRPPSLWKGGPDRGPGRWLAEHGWRSRTQSLAEVARALGRPIRSDSSSGFVTAVRESAP